MPWSIKWLLLIMLVSCSSEVRKKIEQSPPKEETTVDSNLKTFEGQENIVLLLLPLTGNKKTLGESILNTCVLAASEMRNINFFALDIADPSIEKSQIYDFRNKKPKMVIGPIFSRDTKQFGAIFSNVPILTFSNNSEVNSDHVFACGISPQDEIRTLLDYARIQGNCNFLAILPEGELGDQLIEIMKKELEKNNDGENLEILRYSSISTNDATEYARNSGRKIVFVVDPIVKISELNEVFTLNSVALSNADAWNGVIFAFVDNPEQREFIQKYYSVFGKNPSILDMIGYDIMNVAKQSIESRVSSIEGDYNGSLGAFSVKKKEGLRRDLKVFRLENGQKIELSSKINIENDKIDE